MDLIYGIGSSVLKWGLEFFSSQLLLQIVVPMIFLTEGILIIIALLILLLLLPLLGAVFGPRTVAELAVPTGTGVLENGVNIRTSFSVLITRMTGKIMGSETLGRGGLGGRMILYLGMRKMTTKRKRMVGLGF